MQALRLFLCTSHYTAGGKGGYSDLFEHSKKSFLGSVDFNNASKKFLQRMGAPQTLQKLKAPVGENLLKLKFLVCASFI